MKPLKFINTLNETEPELVRQEYIARNVLFFLFIVAFPFTLISFIFYLYGKMPLDTLTIYSTISVMLFVAMILAGMGYWRATSLIPPLLMYFTAVNGNYIGGIDAPGNFMYVLLIMFVAIIYGYRKMWIALGICLATYLCLAWMISSGHIIPYRTAETVFVNRVVLTASFFVIIALLIWLLGRSYRSEVDVRIKAEESLRESEQGYRSIFENTGTSMILIEEDMTISMANGEFVRNTGYSKDEINGRMKWTELVHPDELVRMVEQHRLRRDSSWLALPGYELRYRTKTGDQRDALLNIQLVPGTKKSVASLIDITERKLAEKAMQISEEKYRLLFENAVEGILIIQGDRIKFANPALVEMLGYSSDIITARPFSFFIHPDDRAMVVERHMRRMRGESVETGYDFRIITADGTRRLLHITSQILSWEGEPASLSFVMDITEHRQAEDALRESEERYRSILEDMAEGYYEVDLKGNFTFFNESLCKTFGYSRIELMGMNNRAYTYPEHAKKALLTYSEIYQTGIPMAMTDYEIIRKDGEKRVLETSISPIKKSSGEIIGFRGVLRDMTERKQAEEDKRFLEERLQQADKMESIGTLAGGIAHDFNNLLMGIQGYASMVLVNLDQSNPNYERLKKIEEQVRSGADLTSQLLGFARGGRYEVKPSDMNEIIEKSCSMFGRTKKEITIHRKSEKDLWGVEIDRGQMEQVFLNLFVNAWQAMPGGGDIYLETQNDLLNGEQALFYSLKPGKYVKITVTDTGTGMDLKTKERIFEPFFTTKGMGRGTGLGLASVYGIIKGHEGMITVYSEPDQGTTFTIYLPASEKQIPREETPTDEIVMGTETILLIDDEKIVMEVNKELLESMGYKLYVASSGQEGLDIYMEKKDKIDLIILDMIMPGMSGSDTFDRLREINPNAKVLLSSGYSLTDKALAIMDRGCNGFLQKPFRLEELSGKVREMLGEGKTEGV